MVTTDQYAMFIWYSQEDQAYLVDVPELPGCMADGETVEQAIQAAQKAIRLWIEAARKLGREVPQPAHDRQQAIKPLVAAARRAGDW